MDELINLVGNYGFPMAMCFWFMFRTEKVIKSNTQAINRNSTVLEKSKK